MATPKRIECDVLIVGGGLVGSLLANALATLPVDVLLVEAKRVASLSQPSFDGRATALANGSQRVFEQLGLWSSLRGDAQPIREIHIGERGRFGAARISAREEGVAALGFTVENRLLGEALWKPLQRSSRIQCLSPAEVAEIECRDTSVESRVALEDRSVMIGSKLIVGADGARSRLREALGIGAAVDDYAQAAVIVNCATEEPHRARAFERFTTEGPLAVLPLTRDRVAIVWTLPVGIAERVAGLSDQDFLQALQQAFGYRLGRILKVGRRDRYPLKRVRSADVTRGRAVLIGNAAFALHPVAGQGFNLALRDAAALAEVIADAGDDVGAPTVLDGYRRWRRTDQRKLAGFTHGLVRAFGVEMPGLDALRGIGLMAFDLLPGAKSLLARHTMGLAGRVPRLARHLDLN